MHGMDKDIDFDDGYRLIPAIAPITPTLNYCTPQMVQARRDARDNARDRRLSEFVADCAYHGKTIFDTLTGACLPCLAGNGHLPLQTRFRAAAGTCYSDVCAEHGAYIARFGDVGCTICRRPHSAGRRLARRDGDTEYVAECEVHGIGPFSVRTGECFQCFTSNGAPRGTRPMGRPAQTDNPRATARRGGQTTYLAACEVHGEVAHSVLRGKCLTCYNSLGIARVRPAST